MPTGRNSIKNSVLAEQARMHVEFMEQEFAGETESAVRDSVIYGGPDRDPAHRQGRGCRQSFLNTDSVSAAIRLQNAGGGKVAILNFADYTRPGGIYLRGGNAQEENLCMESNLFNILSHTGLSGYYEYNKGNRNRDLYTDRAIYTPGVVFLREGKEYRFDVLTCAAPNKAVAGRYQHVKTEENHEAMKARVSFMRDVAEDQNVDVLIAGAWGCGAFGQPPTMVAGWLKYAFLLSGVKKVVYAVPSGNGENANTRAFRKLFE